jgi:hypothetical protein
MYIFILRDENSFYLICRAFSAEKMIRFFTQGVAIGLSYDALSALN